MVASKLVIGVGIGQPGPGHSWERQKLRPHLKRCCWLCPIFGIVQRAPVAQKRALRGGGKDSSLGQEMSEPARWVISGQPGPRWGSCQAISTRGRLAAAGHRPWDEGKNYLPMDAAGRCNEVFP